MNLYEYQAKQLFAKYNLPIPNGNICSTLNQAKEYIKNTKGPWVGKCQIQAGGRGKSGGVKILKSENEIQYFMTNWLGKHLITDQTDDHGEIVHNILLEPYCHIINELYLSMLIDRSNAAIVCLVSSQGGVEIEKVAKETPHLINKIFFDPLIGPQVYQARKLGFSLGLNTDQIKQFTDIFMNIGKMFLACDLMLIEINPLVITDNEHLLCLDAKINIDPNALFRQKKMLLTNNIIQNISDTLPSHINDANLKFNYIPMQGNIGCIVNGAGLAMATMDLLSSYGGKVANFLDVGGDVTKESLIESIETIIINHKIKVMLINIFGGIVCCNLIAEGIIKALSTLNVTIPIVVRLQGNNAISGNKQLSNSKYHIIASDNLFHAIQTVISIANQ